MRGIDKMYFDKYAIDPDAEVLAFELLEEEWNDNLSGATIDKGYFEDEWQELE